MIPNMFDANILLKKGAALERVTLKNRRKPLFFLRAIWPGQNVLIDPHESIK